MAGALEGLKVLDLGRIQAAPYCAAILSDMGADVIKVEQPGGGDEARRYLPEETYFAAFNRGKRGMTLDLKRGRDVFLRLADQTDVLIENFRPGVMERLGLSYDVLRERNPRLIYCAISAFGQEGPYRHKAGFDPLLQAVSGIMSVTGFPNGEPVRAGIAVSDILGGLNAAIGILAALHHRSRTGQGQLVDISLAECAISSMSSINQSYLTDREIRGRMGNWYGTGAPGGVYHASDGAFMYAGANDQAWEKLCAAMGRPEYRTDPRLSTRIQRTKHRTLVDEIMNAWTQTMTVEENLRRMEALGLPAGRIMNVAEVYADPQFGKEGFRPMFGTMEHPRLGKVEYTKSAVRLSDTPVEAQGPSPELGEHSQAILEALGYSVPEIQRLREQGII